MWSRCSLAMAFSALELAVAGIGAEAVAALLEKAQAPLPFGVAELAVAPGRAHRRQGLGRFESRAAGQAGEVLQQHVDRRGRGAALLHQPRGQAPAQGTELQQLQGMGGHEQHLGGAAGAVGAAASPLQQPRHVLGRADLHHPLHRLKVHAQIQGAGGHHPAQGSALHPSLDRLPLGPVDGAVVER